MQFLEWRKLQSREVLLQQQLKELNANLGATPLVPMLLVIVHLLLILLYIRKVFYRYSDKKKDLLSVRYTLPLKICCKLWSHIRKIIDILNTE